MRAFGRLLLAPLLAAAGCGEEPGPRLLVASSFTDRVVVLDPDDGRVVDRIEVGARSDERDEPHGLAVTPDGARWLVTTARGEPALTVFGPGRTMRRLPLDLPSAGRPGVAPDGRRAVVPDYWLGGVAEGGGGVVVDLDRPAVVERLTLCPAPHQAVFSPDGRWIAIPCALSDELLLLDGADYSVRHRVALGIRPGAPAVTDPGNPLLRPLNAAWAPDSRRVYLTLLRQGAVAAIDTTGTEVARGATPRQPTQVAVTPDGTRLVVPSRGDFVVSVLDAATLETVDRIVLADGPHPHGVVLSPDGAVAYVTNEGTPRSTGGVTAVRLADGALLWRTEVGAFTRDLVWRSTPGRPVE